MEKVVPTFYSEYGRYISRFRAIPFSIDCLKPVERRVLLVLFQEARRNLVKSARITGTTIAKYHPHGPSSCYDSLVNLVRNGLASDEGGSWGGPGLKDKPPAADRYTETKLSKWVDKFAFDLIDFVPWEELELEKEPIYLPCPLPIGLIGSGIINGMAFHKTVIPKYSIEDLSKRLLWLLENEETPYEIPKRWDKKIDPQKYGPLIKPCKTDCEVTELSPNQFYKLLISGEGEIYYTPKGEIKTMAIQKGKSKNLSDVILIKGRAPNASFGRFISDFDDKKLPSVERPIDMSKGLDVQICLETKKNVDLRKLSTDIWKKYLIKKINFKCYTCDELGNVKITPIDEMLLSCYNAWFDAYNNKLISDVKQINRRILNNEISSKIKNIIKTKSANTVDDIINNFDFTSKVIVQNFNKTKRKFENDAISITEQDVRNVCDNTSITRLVEYQNHKIELLDQFNSIKNELENVKTIALKQIKSYQNGV